MMENGEENAQAENNYEKKIIYSGGKANIEMGTSTDN